MQPNYEGMWKSLEKAIEMLTIDGTVVHVSDLLQEMDKIESDYSH